MGGLFTCHIRFNSRQTDHYERHLFISTGTDLIIKNNRDLYIEVHKMINKDDMISQQIIKDTDRTFPRDHVETKVHQQQLFYILRAHTYIFPQFDYSQGMNFIASFCLYITKGIEEKAFYLFIGVMQKYRYLLQRSSNGFYDLVEVLSSLVNQKQSDVIEHFQTYGIDMIMIVPRWFHTLYVHETFRTKMSLGIWRLIMQPGLEGWINFIQIAVFIFQSLAGQIKNSHSTEHILSLLQNPTQWNFTIPQQLSFWESRKIEFSNEQLSKLETIFYRSLGSFEGFQIAETLPTTEKNLFILPTSWKHKSDRISPTQNLLDNKNM